MTELVKHSFTWLLYSLIGLTLYMIFFGCQPTGWEGLLWSSTRAVEQPVSQYYYKYCYTPNIHKTDYIDNALGYEIISNVEDSSTESCLKDQVADNVARYNASGASSYYYTTGWH